MSYQGPGEYGQQGSGADQPPPYYVPSQSSGVPPYYGQQGYNPPPDYAQANAGGVNQPASLGDVVAEALAAKMMMDQMRQGVYGGYERPRRRRRSPLRFLFTLFMLILIGAVIYLVVLPRVGVNVANPLAPAGPTTIVTSTHPTLILDSSTYTESYKDPLVIKVLAGKAQDRIVLSASDAQAIAFDETPDKSAIVVDVDMLSQQMQAGGTLEVTVPTETNLTIDTNSATIDINGITGKMILTANGGLTTVTGSTIIGPSLISANAGAITIKQGSIRGQAALIDNSGVLTISQTALSGEVTVKNNAGKTFFDGTMDAHGTYTFAANTGALNCTLPANVALHVEATTNSGSIISNDAQLPVQGKSVSADIGAAPRAQVILSSNTSIITLQLQKGR